MNRTGNKTALSIKQIKAASLIQAIEREKFMLCADGTAYSLVDNCTFEVSDPQSMDVFACVGMIDRAYGGPEEGGWYFDTYAPVKAVKCKLADAWKVVERLERQYSNEGRYPVSSVLSEGEYRVSISYKPEVASPEGKPAYC